MVYPVYLIGLMIAFGGLMLMVRPGWVITVIESGAQRPWVYAIAVGGRALLGVLFGVFLIYAFGP